MGAVLKVDFKDPRYAVALPIPGIISLQAHEKC